MMSWDLSNVQMFHEQNNLQQNIRNKTEEWYNFCEYFYLYETFLSFNNIWGAIGNAKRSNSVTIIWVGIICC